MCPTASTDVILDNYRIHRVHSLYNTLYAVLKESCCSHMSYSLLPHTKRASASLWSCRTTSSHLLWTSPHLRLSTPTQEPTFRATHLIQSTRTPAPPFYMSDPHRLLKLPDECEKNSVALQADHDWILHTVSQIPQDWGGTKEELHSLQERTHLAGAHFKNKEETG